MYVLYGWVSCTVSLLFVPLCTSRTHRLLFNVRARENASVCDDITPSFAWWSTLNRLPYRVLRHATVICTPEVMQNSVHENFGFAVSAVEMRFHQGMFSGCLGSQTTPLMSSEWSTWWMERCSCSVNIQAFYNFSVPHQWCSPTVFVSLVFVLYIADIKLLNKIFIM